MVKGNQALHIIMLASCFLASPLQGIVMVGDPDAAPGNTFSFNVGFAKQSQIEGVGRIWMASSQTIANAAAQPYALSYAYQLPAEPILNQATGEAYVPTAIPMANNQNAFLFSYNTTTNLVDVAVTPNPIYGASFSFFDLFAAKPLFILTADLSTLYYAYDIQHPPVQTETNFDKTELLTYNLGAGQTAAALIGASDGIYVAYSSGTFGTDTSNIAKFTTNSQTQTDQKNPQPYIQLLAQETVSTSTPALLGGGASLASLGSSVTLQGFSNITYAGIQATAGGAGNIAAGIMIVNTILTDTTYSLNFSPIALDSALSSTINTIVSAPATESIRITNIAGMQTSTSLNYLIVARDDGAGPQSIYAAPLVSKPGSSYGQIADFTQINNSFGSNPPTFLQRTFTTPLTDPTQIDIENPTDYTAQITVGGGAIPLETGNIKSMYTVGDSVYVVIGAAYATGTSTQPGTFFSQAILAQDGHIIGWSPWARTLGSDSPMNYSHISSTTTANFYICDPTGAGTNFNTVVQTMWTVNQNLSTLFQYSWGIKGGTQGFFNFGQSTTGFNNAMSIIGTTGFNNVSLGQAGYIPSSGSGQVFQVKPMTTSDIVSFNDVSNSTALVALELANDNNNTPSNRNYWLFTGGVSGLAALTNNIGVTKTGNFTSIADFNAGQTWKNIGNFSYIKKLIGDQAFLYILTPTALYQILLDPNKFTEAPTVDLNPVAILTSSQLSQKPYFLDIIIDNGFCILGTTCGMYSFTITNNTATELNSVTIPSGLPAATQLFVTSISNQPQRSFQELSNLYVLNNDFSNQQARINRFTITDGVIEPFNDSILNSSTQPNGIPTSFIRFTQYTSNYFTDGSWNLASNYFLGTTQPPTTVSPTILQIFSTVKNGKSSSQVIMHLLSAYVPSQFLKTVNNFLGIARESTSGACIASGNLPTRINA